jgi:hypothetical protein
LMRSRIRVLPFNLMRMLIRNTDWFKALWLWKLLNASAFYV